LLSRDKSGEPFLVRHKAVPPRDLNRPATVDRNLRTNVQVGRGG